METSTSWDFSGPEKGDRSICTDDSNTLPGREDLIGFAGKIASRNRISFVGLLVQCPREQLLGGAHQM